VDRTLEPDRVIAHRARVVHPVSREPIPNGCVVERGGCITEVGTWEHARASLAPGHEVLDHGDVHLTPGLVNAHAHLELTAHGAIPYNGFLGDWLLAVAARTWELAENGVTDYQDPADAGAAMLRASGCAAIADTTLRGVRARFDGIVVTLHEVMGLTADGEDVVWQRARERVEEDLRAGRPCGLQPHALYSVPPELFRASRRHAEESGCLFGTHLAETVEEMEFVRDGSGPFAALVGELSGGRQGLGGLGVSPVRRLKDLGCLDGSILFHGNYIPDEDFAALAAAGASVVYCPRSHKHFGHENHPAPRMLRAGVNVCIGTDGLVSNEGLDMKAELRTALERCPGLSPTDGLTMATLFGARALRLDGRLGTLSAGMRASFAEFAFDDWPYP